ncbi:MAG: hypothetical protein HY730_00015 [Candidatus Tectomicrobia bacterium]|uniref:Uncharacterized protein n=1 Tax=Tectimicrobiota bacterium TaxID=2528274 RepID=A0A933GKC0_UNCTE|nr:hypothetical protein [Candidatus Tectomicrobia bacterium]
MLNSRIKDVKKEYTQTWEENLESDRNELWLNTAIISKKARLAGRICLPGV